MFYIVKTSANREALCADLIMSKVIKEKMEDVIKSIIYVPEMKGYLFIESDDETYVRKAIFGIPNVKGVVKEKTVDINELEKFFEEKDISKELNKGDIIEITSGPFKGEKGKVIRIDSSKNNITVEILNAVVPIPVTVSSLYVRKVNSDG
jgi:transcriptional antiterminator NusG